MTMQPFTVVTGAAVPLMRANVDTDVIIRIERLTALPREQLGPYALEALRYRADGSEDPGCVFNQPAFRGAPVLLAGANFGCGSSREGAVWALMGLGVRCVIAPRSANDALCSASVSGNAASTASLHARLPSPAWRPRSSRPAARSTSGCCIRALMPRLAGAPTRPRAGGCDRLAARHGSARRP